MSTEDDLQAMIEAVADRVTWREPSESRAFHHLLDVVEMVGEPPCYGLTTAGDVLQMGTDPLDRWAPLTDILRATREKALEEAARVVAEHARHRYLGDEPAHELGVAADKIRELAGSIWADDPASIAAAALAAVERLTERIAQVETDIIRGRSTDEAGLSALREAYARINPPITPEALGHLQALGAPFASDRNDPDPDSYNPDVRLAAKIRERWPDVSVTVETLEPERGAPVDFDRHPPRTDEEFVLAVHGPLIRERRRISTEPSVPIEELLPIVRAHAAERKARVAYEVIGSDQQPRHL